jgi:hypothetical protein
MMDGLARQLLFSSDKNKEYIIGVFTQMICSDRLLENIYQEERNGFLGEDKK